MSKTVPLILHVGHGKTGSSALQSALAISAQRLLDAGICYPAAKSDERARHGHITSGNLPPATLEDRYWQVIPDVGQADSILFSNENLFSELLRDKDGLLRLVSAGVPVRILLFIRNPLGHAISAYGQSIKRGGSTVDIDGFLGGYNIPRKVKTFLDFARGAGIDVTVRNYSRHSRQLIDCMSGMLGLAPGLLEGPSVDIVNRSLTASELYLQRCFNETWGPQSSAFVSDALCNKLPDLPPDNGAELTRQTYDRLVARLKPAIDKVNARIEPDEAYRVEPYESVAATNPADDGRLSFTPEQISVLAGSISKRIPTEDQFEPFLEVLLGLRSRRRISKDDINVLRAFAQIFRPGIKPLK